MPRTRSNQAIPVAIIVLLMAVGCAGPETGPTTTTTQAPVTSEAVTTTATTAAAPLATLAPSTTSAPDAWPPEFSGTWRVDLATGDEVMDRVSLRLSGNGYTINRGPNSGGGSVSVEGDTITFSNSALCSGIGSYKWVIEGDSLTFTDTEAVDPCGGRREVLNGITYSR